MGWYWDKQILRFRVYWKKERNMFDNDFIWDFAYCCNNHFQMRIRTAKKAAPPPWSLLNILYVMNSGALPLMSKILYYKPFVLCFLYNLQRISTCTYGRLSRYPRKGIIALTNGHLSRDFRKSGGVYVRVWPSSLAIDFRFMCIF